MTVTITSTAATNAVRLLDVAIVQLYLIGGLASDTLTIDDANILRHRVLQGYSLAATAAMMGYGWDRADVRQREIRALAALRCEHMIRSEGIAAGRTDECEHVDTTMYVSGEQCDECGHRWSR